MRSSDLRGHLAPEVLNEGTARLGQVPRLSIVIPSYRRPDLVRKCLASLRPAIDRCADDVEVVVVDDGSGDGAATNLAAEHPWALFVNLPVNLGYAGAVNVGLGVAAGEWLFTLNNDTTVDQNVLSSLLTTARGSNDVGHLAAQQRFDHDRDRLCSAGLVLDRMGVNAERLIGQPIEASEMSPVEVFGACGGAAVYRRRMVEDLGGLDETFVFGLEDADLAWRAQMRGWRCLYVPDAVVFHEYGATVAHGTDLRFLQAGRNRIRLILKNATPGMLVRYGLMMVAYDVAYVLYTVAVHRTLMPLRGRLEVLRDWRRVRASGASGRRPIALAPAQGIRAAMRRRRAWLRMEP